MPNFLKIIAECSCNFLFEYFKIKGKYWRNNSKVLNIPFPQIRSTDQCWPRGTKIKFKNKTSIRKTKNKRKKKTKKTKMKNKMITKTKIKIKISFRFCFRFVVHFRFCFCFCFLEVFTFLLTPRGLEGP